MLGNPAIRGLHLVNFVLKQHFQRTPAGLRRVNKYISNLLQFRACAERLSALNSHLNPGRDSPVVK